jgi:hypothetical protein
MNARPKIPIASSSSRAASRLGQRAGRFAALAVPLKRRIPAPRPVPPERRPITILHISDQKY